MKYIRGFVTFLRLLFKDWGAILLILPTIYSLGIYLPKPYNQFQLPLKYNFLVPAFGFLIAGFRVWLKEKDEKDLLVKELDNPITYDVKSSVGSVNFKFDDSYYQKEIEEVQNKINQVTTLPNPLQSLQGLNIHDLQYYKKELEKYKNEWNLLQIRRKRINKVDLFLVNSGNAFDENVKIIVSIQDKKASFNRELSMPELPEKNNQIIPFIKPKFNIDTDVNTINFCSKSFEVEIPSIRATEKKELIHNGFFVFTHLEKISIEARIISKNIKKPIIINREIDLTTINSVNTFVSATG